MKTAAIPPYIWFRARNRSIYLPSELMMW